MFYGRGSMVSREDRLVQNAKSTLVRPYSASSWLSVYPFAFLSFSFLRLSRGS